MVAAAARHLRMAATAAVAMLVVALEKEPRRKLGVVRAGVGVMRLKRYGRRKTRAPTEREAVAVLVVLMATRSAMQRRGGWVRRPRVRRGPW